MPDIPNHRDPAWLTDVAVQRVVGMVNPIAVYVDAGGPVAQLYSTVCKEMVLPRTTMSRDADTAGLPWLLQRPGIRVAATRRIDEVRGRRLCGDRLEHHHGGCELYVLPPTWHTRWHDVRHGRRIRLTSKRSNTPRRRPWKDRPVSSGRTKPSRFKPPEEGAHRNASREHTCLENGRPHKPGRVTDASPEHRRGNEHVHERCRGQAKMVAEDLGPEEAQPGRKGRWHEGAVGPSQEHDPEAQGRESDSLECRRDLHDLPSSDGTTITFTLPEGMSVCPPFANRPCILSVLILTPGEYTLSVMTTDGTSNGVKLVVASGPPSPRPAAAWRRRGLLTDPPDPAASSSPVADCRHDGGNPKAISEDAACTSRLRLSGELTVRGRQGHPCADAPSVATRSPDVLQESARVGLQRGRGLRMPMTTRGDPTRPGQPGAGAATTPEGA